MNHRVLLFWKHRLCGLFCYAIVCGCLLAVPSWGTIDGAVEQRLNEIYSQLRHTLTPAEKESLKQEELDWLKKRGRFLSGDPQWIELTEERIRELEARLSGESIAPISHQTEIDVASPDGQYRVAANEPSSDGLDHEIELKTAAGEKLLALSSGARLGFEAEWSADSKYVVVIIPGRFNGRRYDTMVLAEKNDGEWKTVEYTRPGGWQNRILRSDPIERRREVIGA